MGVLYVLFSDWLMSLSPMSSKVIHGWCVSECPSFSRLSHTLFRYGPQFIYSFICRWTSRWLPPLAIVNRAAKDTGLSTCLWGAVFSPFGYILRTGFAGSYHSSFDFLRPSHTSFCGSYTIWPPPARKESRGVRSGILIKACDFLFSWEQPGYWDGLISTVVLLCISLMSDNTEHLSILLLAIEFLIEKNPLLPQNLEGT
jgi:hypothetical protein